MLMRGRKLRNLPMPSVNPRIAAKQAALFPVRIQTAPQASFVAFCEGDAAILKLSTNGMGQTIATLRSKAKMAISIYCVWI